MDQLQPALEQVPHLTHKQTLSGESHLDDAQRCGISSLLHCSCHVVTGVPGGADFRKQHSSQPIGVMHTVVEQQVQLLAVGPAVEGQQRQDTTGQSVVYRIAQHPMTWHSSSFISQHPVTCN